MSAARCTCGADTLMFFIFKKKTAYEMRISDWSSDVCSSDLGLTAAPRRLVDSSLASHVTLDGVEVDADAVIGEVDAGGEILDALLAATRTGAAAERVGVGQGARATTGRIGRGSGRERRCMDGKM